MITDDVQEHTPTLVYFEGRHSIPAEVCGTCSNEAAGRWVPVTMCALSAAQMGAGQERAVLHRDRTAADDDDYVHVVGGFQHWLDRLRLKVPRALCGVLLVGDPDRPEPGADAPVCPACAARCRS